LSGKGRDCREIAYFKIHLKIGGGKGGGWVGVALMHQAPGVNVKQMKKQAANTNIVPAFTLILYG